MSLDVYLYGKPEVVECTCPDCGHIHTKENRPRLFDYNITHNLGEMAEYAGLYGYLWEPDSHNITKASDLIEPLKNGLKELERFPATYSALNPENGWGDYNGLVKFVKAYLQECEANPEATIEVSR